MNSNFDDIRPYTDAEFREAIPRIVAHEAFPMIASWVYPELSLADVVKRVTSFKTIREFQHDTMYKVNEQVIARSIDTFTCSGIERLSKDKPYLYVSNHRDIMLDSSLLQYFLVSKGFETTQITFGANLMTHPLVVDLGKSNKMFKVARPGGGIREFYRGSLHLSQYIREAITVNHESVWIAQRNGRTKDGNDATDQGIIKMFCLSEQHDKIKAIADLHIVPISVSYEWESCDVLKTLELYESQFMRYVKKPGEDLNSILSGITHYKGRVHMELCEPISLSELMAFEGLTNVEYHRAVARLIDSRINTAYRLYPNNYIAHDILFGNQKYRAMYTDEQFDAFVAHMECLNRYDSFDLEQLKEIFLGIYANPVDNK